MSGSRFSWTGLTTTQFADHLNRLMAVPVVDETGLSEKFNVDFEIPHAVDDAAEEPILDEVEMLGLKLSPRRAPVDLLVIDKVSKRPLRIRLGA